MAGNQGSAEQGQQTEPRRKAGLIARILVVLAAAAGIFWLFVIYTPPAVQAYPNRERVVFWHMWTSDHAKIVARIIERFNQSQDKYEVTGLSMPAAGSGSLKTLISAAGGNPPDCMAHWDPVIPAWAERGALTPLEDLMKPGEWESLQGRLYPAVKAIGMYKGHFYGLSIGMNVFAMYYRPSHLQAAGLDPDKFPETLEELDQVQDKLWQYKTINGEQAIRRIGFMPVRLQDWIAVFGGSLYDPASGQLTITNPRNVAALEWMTEYARKYDFQKVTVYNAGQGSQLVASWPFLSDAYSITIDGQWRIEEIDRYAKGMDYRTAAIPYPKDGKPMAGWSNGNFMIIPASAKHKEGAWAFMRFWSGLDEPQRAAEFYTWGGWLPVVPQIAEAPVYQAYMDRYPQFRTFLKILSSPNLQVTPPVPVQAYLFNRIGKWEETPRRTWDKPQPVSPLEAMKGLEGEILREQRLQSGK